MPRQVKDEKVYIETCQLFTELGYQGMTTKLIAQRAGINEVTLFRKYQSKAELVCRSMNYVFSQVPLSQVTWTGDLSNDITSIVQKYLDSVVEYGPLMQVLAIEFRRNSELETAMDTIKSNIKRVIEVIEKYRSQGKLRGTSSIEICSSLLGPLAMTALNILVPENTSPDLPNPEVFVNHFLKGFVPENTRG